MMKVLVTGGSGRIGRYVVRELATAGHAVTNIDLQPSPDTEYGEFLRVNLTDSGEVYQALARSGAEAVVHLGAWANPGMVPDTRTYGENVQSTYNIFQACADMGIKRVVNASSAQVYGFAAAPPVYVPVDEAHPLRPVNCYALSKTAGEQAADYFVANYGMTILSFRFMGVRQVGDIPGEIETIKRDPAAGQWLLWSRTDGRDGALACRLAIEADNPPSGAYNITGGTVLSENPAALVKQYFGDHTEIRGDLTATPSLLSCARAEQAFGYRPNYLWSQTQQYPE